MEQLPFNVTSNDLVRNPEHRCPSVLLLDISGSMQGDPVKQLQDGVNVYRDSLFGDSLARKRVEVAIVTFGGRVDVVQTFTTADTFNTPTLDASGDTPMGEAVVTALKLLADRKVEYQAAGIQYYRPWVFLITDGGPTDVNSSFWAEAKNAIRDGEAGKKFAFFTVGVEDADLDRLTELNPARPPVKLQGLEFKKMFQWLSTSQQAVSRSMLGDTVPLQDPTAGPTGWATV